MGQNAVPLTQAQVRDCVARMSAVFRAAMLGLSLTGYNVSLSGVTPDELCFPLTAEQLTGIRRCRTFTRQVVEAVHCPNPWDEQEGLLTFRVRYAVDGCDADGRAVSVEEEGVLSLLCFSLGLGAFGEVMCIRDVERCRVKSDGSIQRPGRLQRSLRSRGREKRNSTSGGFWVELVGAMVEFVAEVFFDN